MRLLLVLHYLGITLPCVSYTGYVLTFVLIFAGFANIYFNDHVNQYLSTLIFETFIRSLLLSFSISSFLFGSAYLVLRTLWWGYLANAIAHIPQRLGEEDFASLHQRCADYAHGKGRKIRFSQKITTKASGGLSIRVILIWLFSWLITFFFLYGLLELMQ